MFCEIFFIDVEYQKIVWFDGFLWNVFSYDSVS